MSAKTLYLDTYALARVSDDEDLQTRVRRFITDNGYLLVINVFHFMEVYPQKSSWQKITKFISSTPFCIAYNPEQLLEVEVKNYPRRIVLPSDFYSRDYPSDELASALIYNLENKAGLYRSHFDEIRIPIFKHLIAKRDEYLKSHVGQISNFDRKTFLMVNVAAMMFPEYGSFLMAINQRGEAYNEECFASLYIQTLAIFIEYYEQKKNGKSSALGDFSHLSYLPYVGLAVLDAERHDLITRINRRRLYLQNLNTLDWKGFLQHIS